MTRTTFTGTLGILALGLVTAGCGSSSKSHVTRGATAAATTTASVLTASTTAPPPATPATPPATTPPPASTGSNVGSPYWYIGDTFGNPLKPMTASEDSLAQQVLTLVNQERALAGVPALRLDLEAQRAAKAHCEDMNGRTYFDHISPEGWTPEDRLRMTGASGYVFAGENIAVGQRTAREVMDAWMASPGHRMNILDARYTHLGVGLDEPSLFWAQVFLRR
jgi:uncharacterized protein YkwD